MAEWIVPAEKELDEEEIVYLNAHGARELVRCEDCKYGIVETDTQCFCEARVEENGLAYHEPNWFCAYGRKKDGETKENSESCS